MYKEIDDFLNIFFPHLEGCILFGSYTTNSQKANDIDLLLCDNKFSFAYKESFKHKGKIYNVIKVNPLEILNILAEQYKRRNFFSQIFKTGIIVSDKTGQLHEIRKMIFPISEDSDAIAESLNETLHKIFEHLIPLKTNISFTEKFIISSKLISYTIDGFLLSKGIFHLNTEKAKIKFLKEKFPKESTLIESLIQNLISKKDTLFLKNLESVLVKFNLPISYKHSNYVISDDFSTKQVVLFIGKTYSFKEIASIITFLHSINYIKNFNIYQVDSQNTEKEGCYITFENTKKEILENRELLIQSLKNYFQNKQFIFPYNNIYCHKAIKFGNIKTSILVDELLENITKILVENPNISKENLIYSFIIQFTKQYKIPITAVENYYTIRLDVSAKSSNFFVDYKNNNRDKLLSANDKNSKKLIDVFENEVQYKLEKLTNISILVQLQIIDRVLSVFLNKDFEKLFYVHCIKNKLNAEVPQL